MKAYFDPVNPLLAILVIEPESPQEEASLAMWHQLNVSEQSVYGEMAGVFAGFEIKFTKPDGVPDA